MTQQLQTKPSSKGKKIELVIHQLNSLPTLPAVAARLLQITVRSDTQAKEVVSLIESDPSLSSRIITLATRANTGVSKRSASLSKAVVLLGFDAVRNAVLSIQVFETLNRANSQDSLESFDRVGFWKHSLAVACAAKMLIGHIDKKVDPEEAFVCGLLHDIGKLALDTALPKSFSRVVQLTESSMGNIAEVEKKIFGLDHTIVGRRLAEKWNLPDSIAETVWLHHQWIKGIPDSAKNHSIVQTVHLADLIARRQRIGYSGNHLFQDSAASISQELGCPATIIEQVARQLPEAISERASILGLDDIEPEELYYDALGEANSELGRLNARLQQHNQKLELRSKYFDLLTRFDKSLMAKLSVVDVCDLIAKLWQEHTGCTGCGVYGKSKEEMIFEGALKLDSQTESSTFFVDLAEDAHGGTAEANANYDIQNGFCIRPVDSSAYWFFEQVAPMLEIESTLIIPLYAENERIGAILWQSENPQAYHQHHIKEIQSFAISAALAMHHAQKNKKESTLSEHLALSNSKLQKAQQELLHKQSLAAVGEMACGAAHEINNPLAVIVGRTQLLSSSEPDPKRKETLEIITRNGKEISNIITDLLEFAQPSQPKPTVVNVETLITEVAKTQSQMIQQADRQGDQQVEQTEKISIETDLQDDVPDVFVDTQQISQALTEVIANAIESYGSEPGAVTLIARYDELDDVVVVEVIDQGCGMDEQTLEKAAGPFFSDKQAGRKRGLGLSRSIRNIESNGGRLRLESRHGQGTCVRITLPPAQGIVADE